MLEARLFVGTLNIINPFFKRQNLKIKITKSRRRNQILRQFFTEEPLVIVLNTYAKKLFKNSRV